MKIPKFFHSLWIMLGLFIEQAMFDAKLILGVTFEDIDKTLVNGNNMGGITHIYYGLWDDVETWPSLPDSPSTLEELPVITGNIDMHQGKKMFKLESTRNTASMAFAEQGEVDGKSFRGTLTITNPGLRKKLLGFAAAAKNEDLFFIVKDSEGTMYLFGDEHRPANMDGGEGLSTGAAAADKKQASLAFIWDTNTPIIYEGTVPLTEASS